MRRRTDDMTAETGNGLIDRALRAASDTRDLRVGRGALAAAPNAFRACFGDAAAVVVADANTFRAAGHDVLQRLRSAGIATREPIVFDDPDLHAETAGVERIEALLRPTAAVPVAVGSGTINDLTKLASHRCDRPYMVVATAASMDGYTAFGASISHEGSKETFDCPAPRVVIADMDILAAAPPALNAAGYADLLAKVVAGADWILADALGVEPIEPTTWAMVQGPLRRWVAPAEAIRRGEAAALRGLVEGLLTTGFAMQYSRSSRAASGAEHQYSHLWDMQHHRHEGRAPLHGFKVGIGTLAVARLYEALLAYDVCAIDVERAEAEWPDLDAMCRFTERTFGPPLTAMALREVRAKYVDRAEVGRRLRRMREVWPDLRRRLREQLIPSAELVRMLHAAGAPTEPEQIGIDRARLRRSHTEAWLTRRRFTILDLVGMAGLWTALLDRDRPPQEASHDL